MAEYFDIVDENGEPTGETVERETAHLKGIRHRTAHLWLFREKNGKIQVLLQKRSANKDSFPGCYDISSAGHIPAGDGYRKSAVRELKEELGVTAEESDLIFCGDRKVFVDDTFRGKQFKDRQYSRVFMMWFDLDESFFTLQKEEVESVLWMDFDECVDKVKGNLIDHCIAVEELNILAEALPTV